MSATPYGAAAASRAADAIRARVGSTVPVAGIILGSGLGGLAQRIAKPIAVPFAEVPGFPTATVVGHAGNAHRRHARGPIGDRAGGSLPYV